MKIGINHGRKFRLNMAKPFNYGIALTALADFRIPANGIYLGGLLYLVNRAVFRMVVNKNKLINKTRLSQSGVDSGC